MIYITGDTHAEEERFSPQHIWHENEWTREDKIIVCGDFGFVWSNTKNKNGKKKDNAVLDRLAQKPYEILFCCGNHENFDELFKYPEVERYNEKVRKIRDNIYYLQRGRIYTIEGKTFFVFGGARSVDRYMRKEGLSWWAQELPSEEEYLCGIQSLEKAEYKVDYIITHTAANSIVQRMFMQLPLSSRIGYVHDPKDFQLMSYLDEIEYKTQYKHWYFGHWHYDVEVSSKATAVWYKVKKIQE